jgi:hypothetical protein
MGVIENLNDAARLFQQYSYELPPHSLSPSLPPSPPPTPEPLVSREVQAVRLLLKSVKPSEDEWLSVDEIMEMIEIFRHNENAAEVYITFAGHSNESLTRKWVRKQLSSKRDKRPSEMVDCPS